MSVELVPVEQFEYPEYDSARRARLLNKCLYRAEQLVDEVATPREMQQMATAVSMLIDRKRLEDGESTSREEVVNVVELREAFVAKLNELAERDRLAAQVRTQGYEPAANGREPRTPRG